MRLTGGELKVMQVLWKHGELKPAQIQELFPEPIKNPALRSYLTILVDKGHVSRRKMGKVFLYKAKTRQQSVFSRMLNELIQTFCGGSATQLMLTLAEREKLTPHQLAELRAAASLHDEAANETSPAQNPKRKSAKRRKKPD